MDSLFSIFDQFTALGEWLWIECHYKYNAKSEIVFVKCSKEKLMFNVVLLLLIGCQIGEIKNTSSVRSCNFSYSANMAAYSTDAHLRQQCEILIIDVRNADESIGSSFLVSAVNNDIFSCYNFCSTIYQKCGS